MCGPSAGAAGAGVFTGGLEPLMASTMPNSPGAPTLPQYPGLTPAEQTNLGQQSQAASAGANMLQGVSGQLGNNQQILQMISGLFNQDGSINQGALSQLQQQSTQSTQAAGQQGQAALQGLGGTNAAMGATSQAYTNALQNGAPANQQLAFQQNQSFQQMQEQAAQQGIPISGTNFSNAVSNSTAGQKLIQNFQQNANMQNQNYNLGYVSQLSGNMGQLATAGQNQANTGIGLGSYATQTPLNYLQNSITNGQSALSPLLSNYENQLSTAYSPLYNQQIGPYQQQMAQAQATYQGQVGQYNAQMGQNGALMGAFMPAVSFMGMGVNPSAGANDASKGMGTSTA